MIVNVRNARKTWGEESPHYRRLRDMVEEEIDRLRGKGGSEDKLAGLIEKLSLA